MARTTTHTVTNGFCTVCGETAEWLAEHGAAVELVPSEYDAPVVSTYTVEAVGAATGPVTLRWDEPMGPGDLLATVSHWEAGGDMQVKRVTRDCDGAVMVATA